MFLSIIIPVYNAEKYINDCLLSCITQNISANDYEIICVNDGSKDSSLSILQDFASKNKNIIIIDKSNEGVSAARNDGMKVASGEYIWFVDSDDVIKHNCLQYFKDICIKEKADKIKFKFIETENTIPNVSLGVDQLKQEHKNYQYGTGIWTCLHNNEYLKKNKISFNTRSSYAEDHLFNFEFDLFNPTIKYVDYIGYFYRRVSSSATKKINILKLLDSSFTVAKVVLDYTVNKNYIGKDASLLLWSWKIIICNLSNMNMRDVKSYIKNKKEIGIYKDITTNFRSLKKFHYSSKKKYFGGILANILCKHCDVTIAHGLMRIASKIL